MDLSHRSMQFKLADCAQNLDLLRSTSTFLAQKVGKLDCTGVDTLDAEQLDALFSAIPADWDADDLSHVILEDTLSDRLADCLLAHRDLETAPESANPSPLPAAHSPPSLDVFQLRDRVIDDYRCYIESFLTIRDPRIEQFVQSELEDGALWQDPLVQLNPAYQRTATVDQLIAQNLLHPDCAHYFPGFHFYAHQEQAFRCYRRNQPYVLTTGTGSGKSLSYVVPVIDDLLRHPELPGVRAILVYPMNALINSQKAEFEKFLEKVPGTPIRVESYTGQESLSEKTEIQNHPPQILLTNYVMLELMLSRVHEDSLVQSPQLKFLVLDELHTYRGRQGADVALVIRKLSQRCGKTLLCIGTSATMATEGSRSDRHQTVAQVAGKLFGQAVPPENVIDETLERKIHRPLPDRAELADSLAAGLPLEAERDAAAFAQHPLSAWIEMNFGLAEEEGRLVRRTPMSLPAGAALLAEQTGQPAERCQELLQQMLLWSSRLGQGGLPFRLHQFISQGGSVYATLEPRDRRLLTLEGQYKTEGDRLLFPLVFCRECGQEYYVARYDSDRQTIVPLLPTTGEIEDEDNQEGYLTLDEPDFAEAAHPDNLPDNWFRLTKRQGRTPKKEFARFIPRRLAVYPDGRVTEAAFTRDQAEAPQLCWFVPRPFLTCLSCGIVHDRRGKEYRKLARLSSEGRSTATTLLCLSAISYLQRDASIPPEAAKVLSFTDNRQDASLQAGHFNDFVRTSFLRASLHAALRRHQILTHENLPSAVVQQMGLTQQDYAQTPTGYSSKNENVFKKLIEYRLYEDLRRGWRIVQPNLEQCGLLAIEYAKLQEACRDARRWQKFPHAILHQATPEQRYDVAKTLLDQLRRNLILDAKILQPQEVEQLGRAAYQALNDTWRPEGDELTHKAGWALLEAGDRRDRRESIRLKLTARSAFGHFLRSPRAWPWLKEPLSQEQYDTLIAALANVLTDSGYLRREGNAIQLRVDSLLWRAVEVNELPPDLLTAKHLSGKEPQRRRVNTFFQNFYQKQAASIQSVEGREHTGQVCSAARQQREVEFRAGRLAALFCSPTMELGIDISDLNVVHLRNVPPSPANYAQRSGRAGRGGQGALAIAYAAAGSGHDQYFYHRQEQMVAGIVMPPKLELANEDLLRSHVYSLWLAFARVDLGKSMNAILDLSRDGYPLQADFRSQLSLQPQTLERCRDTAQAVLADCFCQADLRNARWYSAQWLDAILKNALHQFDRACDRWRQLYQDAVNQLQAARRTIDRSARGDVTAEERKRAEYAEHEAQCQIDLLVGQGQQERRSEAEFEFYPYRYFADEGFLPGFNFPRLPVRAFIQAGEQSDFLTRPRVVAIRELAPSNIVYYEGSKYQVVKTRVPASGLELQRVTVCAKCGYFHSGDRFEHDVCENCGAPLGSDRSGNPAKLNYVLPMDTAITRRRDRITCDEEERLKYGYNVTTHFRYADQRCELATVEVAGEPVLKLSYGETAQILRLNRGLRRAQERGFKLDTATGLWGEPQGESEPDTLQSGVHLMVQDTSNILVVEALQLPPTEAETFLATLQHALERAIQARYKLETDELASERLGEGQYLLFWEAAEGGAGVLSQLLEQPEALQYLAREALDICHFQTPKDSCAQACYECLLSYRNQFDHPLLNRHAIRPFLDQLLYSTINYRQSGEVRDALYRTLLAQIDPNSAFEREVLETIYQRGLKLPDAAQELVPEANCKPDFLYKSAKVALFCDGSVHDGLEQQGRDRVARDNLEHLAGYLPLSLRHDQDWRAKLDDLATLI